MFPLDDDDLFLPKRLIHHILEYDENKDLDLYRNRYCYICNGVNMEAKPFHSSFSNSSFTRRGYFKSGGYTNFNKSNHDDLTLRANFNANCNVKIISDLDTCDFIYQFDGGRYHNTTNHDPLMNEDFKKLALQYKKTGTIKLSSDFEVYDEIVNIVNDVISTKEPVPITTTNDGANIIRR
jgi:hypothetical protein